MKNFAWAIKRKHFGQHCQQYFCGGFLLSQKLKVVDLFNTLGEILPETYRDKMILKIHLRQSLNKVFLLQMLSICRFAVCHIPDTWKRILPDVLYRRMRRSGYEINRVPTVYIVSWEIKFPYLVELFKWCNVIARDRHVDLDPNMQGNRTRTYVNSSKIYINFFLCSQVAFCRSFKDISV